MRESARTLAPEISVAELAALIGAITSRRLRGKHLEIGTAAGGTLRELVQAYPQEDRPPFVVIDPMTYFPNQMELVQRNLTEAGLDPSEIDFRMGFSWPAFQHAEKEGETFSFIFVDGSHKIHHVTEDLAWSRLLEPGGLICFHDYCENFPGVMASVDRFLKRYENYRAVTRVENLLVVEKTAPSEKAEITAWDRLRAKMINVVHQLRAGIKKRIR